MDLCDYGCGKPAIICFLKIRKHCCSEWTQQCDVIKEKTSKSHIGLGHTQKTKKQLSKIMKKRNKIKPIWEGRHHTEESKIKIGLKSKNRECKDETRKKMSLVRIGEKNANWKGGISLEPYCFEFTKDLKEFIKERDFYKCRNPNCVNGKHLCVHHVDYNKKNCILENLITLCFSCNSKANFNREFWVEYYQNLLKKGK